ncbi:MAG: hypothetical protein OER82_12320 [Nitrosopumilus sp.]|nr:hypothetical protein [Nitrosopumilus sp.]
MKFFTITVLVISVILLSVGNYQIQAQTPEDETEEDSPWGTIIGVIIGIAIISVIGPAIKKRHTKKLLKEKELFRRPSFFVQKIRYTGLNITYAILFDTERILFVHAHKISKAPKESSVEEILAMSKHNFLIPIDEIISTALTENTEGPNGARSGILEINSKGYKGSFDIMKGQKFTECREIVDKFCHHSNSI